MRAQSAYECVQREGAAPRDPQDSRIREVGDEDYPHYPSEEEGPVWRIQAASEALMRSRFDHDELGVDPEEEEECCEVCGEPLEDCECFDEEEEE